MNPLIFLDIDGVLNSQNFRPRNPNGLQDWLDIRNVEVLNELVRLSGADLVISSSWRLNRTREELQATLASAGCLGNVIDMTPDLISQNGERWEEIQLYLVQRGIPLKSPGFVILDDEFNMDLLSRWHVRTSRLCGLVRMDIPIALGHLGDFE